MNAAGAPRVTWHGMAAALLGTLSLSFLPIIASALLLLLYERQSGVDVDVVMLTVLLLVLRQLTVFTVSTHMHRSAAHKHFTYHPVLERVMRAWNFIWSGSTRVWAVMHRVHHAESDTAADVHSPHKPGGSVWNVIRQTSDSYFATARDLEKLGKYDIGLPDDALERFTVWASRKGPLGMILTRAPVVLGAFWLAFGWQVALCLMPGAMLSLWTSMILITNGFAHRFGYRALPSRDQSTNIFPVDLFAFGELLHHNHHALPGRANLAVLPFELDVGFWLLAALEKVGLVRDLKR